MKTFFVSLVFVVALAFCQPGFAAPHKLRVDDPAVASALVARGSKVIGDYGAFTVLEADDSLLGPGESNRVEVADNWNLIRLNAQAMDTRAPRTKALRKPLSAFAGKHLHLVHFAGPVKPEWLEGLQQSGAQIISYIPENAYLIYGDSPALARMQAWAGASEFVQWEGEYSHDLKIHPKARAAAVRMAAEGKVEVDTFSIQLVVDANSNPSTLALIDRLKGAPATLDFQLGKYHNLVVSLPADQLDTIAAQPDVISIQPYLQPKKRDERQDQIIAGNLTGNSPTGPGYLAWLASKGFTQAQFDASGFIVDVADSGIDNGTNTPGHFGLYRLGDTADSSRVAYARVEGHLHNAGTLSGCDGHGAMNAHIIGNYDDFTGSQHKDSGGFSYGMGVCPFVKLGSSVIFDNSGENDYTDPNFSTMVSDAYQSGARIINNSWGSDVGGDYDIEAQTYDQLVRDAQSGTKSNQEMVIVFAAGNAGPCTTNFAGIDSPGSAKNVITVGASENVRSLSTANGGFNQAGDDYCGEGDTDANNANDINCASSRGPCTDGRMKPDLMAPGVHITGGVPQISPPPAATGTGSAISCFDASGVCALPNSGGPGNPDNFFPLGQQFYTESSGTSHSTPAVAGACALIRQFFINSNFTAPSPAMTKAFLINSARYMTGLSANDTLWSPNQGMGELNLGLAFDGVPRFLRDQISADKFTGTGQTRSFTGQIVDTNKPFRVTVAWTDAPGSTAGAAYNNDLDLTVNIGGNTYKGNIFSGQYSITGGSADRENNVESVFLPPGAGGDFTVTITAANINSDGVPGEAPSLDQDFALVIYNAEAETVPAFTPFAGNFSGLFDESGGVEFGRSGAIAIKTATAGSYSGKLQLGAKSYSFTGKFDSSGGATNPVVRKGASTLSLAFSLDLTNNDVITGTVADPGVWTANLQANRAVFNAKTNPAASAGRYTLSFPGTNGGGQFPSGDGYGTVTVDSTGKVKLAGSLADGTKISQSAVASEGGEWPLYISLYSGQGQIFGWLLFTNSGPETPGGDVSWFKPPILNAKIYRNGFDFKTHATGSAYNPKQNPSIGFTNGVVILTVGNLSVAITNSVSVAGATVMNLGTNKLTLKLAASTGVFKGSVANPFTRGSISFNGVFVQNQNFGAGYFLGTNQSGRVFFGPAD